MTELERFRDHCRTMSADGAHLPTCESLNLPRQGGPIWSVECDDEGVPSRMLLRGFDRGYTPPTCDGCVPESDRALFARMAAEVDEYLTTDDAPLWEDA